MTADSGPPGAPEDGREASELRRRLERTAGAKQKRRMRAREQGEWSVWFGLGTFGLVGWSIAIPTLIGIAMGMWIDARLPSRYSWTIMLMFAGVITGCLNAWWWVQRESRTSERQDETR